ncbi:MAG: hypothetical protein K0R92_1072 [Lachnospiraceae bacterium]|nr:hypothetical protein [Lachnospiraceae bacterium]
MAMIGFIGAGNMGYPMLLGAMKVFAGNRFGLC